MLASLKRRSLLIEPLGRELSRPLCRHGTHLTSYSVIWGTRCHCVQCVPCRYSNGRHLHDGKIDAPFIDFAELAWNAISDQSYCSVSVKDSQVRTVSQSAEALLTLYAYGPVESPVLCHVCAEVCFPSAVPWEQEHQLQNLVNFYLGNGKSCTHILLLNAPDDAEDQDGAVCLEVGGGRVAIKMPWVKSLQHQQNMHHLCRTMKFEAQADW